MKLHIKGKHSTKHAMENKGKFIVILIQFNQAGQSSAKTYKNQSKNYLNCRNLADLLQSIIYINILKPSRPG
jgi:hypothetical protein